MARDFAAKFYASRAWEQTRLAFLQSKHFLCERCQGPATTVHHRVYLTPSNIADPEIALGWQNLEAICPGCHHIEHYGGEVVRDDVCFNSNGELIKKNR